MIEVDVEAAEIVLGEKPWYHCFYCAGRGWQEKEPEVGDVVTIRADGTATAVRPCPSCGGMGRSRNEPYHLAREQLGLPALHEPPLLGIENHGRVVEGARTLNDGSVGMVIAIDAPQRGGKLIYGSRHVLMRKS